MIRQIEQADTTALDWAMRYREMGLGVIPIPIKSKAARIKWAKYQKEQPDEAQLRKWFQDKQCNMGLMMGAISGGLTCLDFDRIELYEQWAKEHPELASELPTVETSRGRHVYFRSNLTQSQPLEGIDLKASGYMIAPSSIHPSGMPYRWLIPLENGLPLLNDISYHFGLFTEEREEIDESEEKEEIEDNEAIRERGEREKRSSASVISPPPVSDELIEDAISNTLPKSEGQRNWKIFQYGRWLKGIPELANCTAKQMKPFVRQWYERALPMIATKDFATTWADFAYGWPRVKWPRTENEEFQKAICRALGESNRLPEEQEYDKEEVKLLVRICYELQELNGEEPFHFSCIQAGDILGVSHTQANSFMNMLVADGVLVVAKKNTAYKSTRYYFISQSTLN